MRYYPAFLRRYLTRHIFQKIEGLTGAHLDIIWSFDNSLFYDFDALSPSVLKISHIVDLNQDFETARAARTADFCFCTTQLIRARLEQHAPNKVYWINHGLSNSGNYLQNKESLPGQQTIKALYAGNLAMKYLDWQIIGSAVNDNPNVDFIFYGSNRDNTSVAQNPMHSYKKEVLRKPNTYFPGQLSSDELGHALKAADVLLLSYQEAHHQDQANPHKILEYLYSGKPIIGTYTAEYQDTDLLYMTKSNQEWPDLFKLIVHDFPKYSKPAAMEKRKVFALDNTYDKQIERIEGLIDQHLNKSLIFR
jgi:glycosyltransferase involved in cell wall biosynthesis